MGRRFGSSMALMLVVALSANLPALERLPAEPVPIVATPPAIVSLAAGNSHSVARRFDGTVWSWGANFNSQLGDGTTTNRLVPTQIVGFEGVAAVSAGLAHSMAVKEDGTIWTWGNTGSGRLGRGGDATRPGQVAGLAGMIAASAGSAHSLSVRGTDGTVWAWGSNVSGQLGNGSTSDSSTPVQVLGLSGVTTVAAGENHSVALKADGTVWAWGLNDKGQLGTNSNLVQETPVQAAINSVTSIASGHSHVLARRSDGTVFAWGFNNRGQLGYGFVGVDSAVPSAVVGLSGVASVAASAFHSLAARTDGTMASWGRNISGQLGDGSTTDRSRFVTTAGPGSIEAIATGGSHSLGAQVGGSVYAWGSNASGQLGEGTTTNHLTPFKIPGFLLWPPPVADPQTCGARFGHTVATTVRRGDVDTGSGIFSTAVTDASLPGIGLPFGFVRTYNSACTGTSSLGPGWTHAYAASLSIGVPAPGKITFVADDAQQIVFTAEGGGFSSSAGGRSTLVPVTGGYELTRRDQVRYRFDSAGRLLSIKERNGQGLTMAYDGAGRVDTITDSVGRIIDLSYDPAGRLTSLALPDGRFVAYTYQPDGRLASVDDLRRFVTTYRYDGVGRLDKITDANGHEAATITYEPTSGRVATVRDAKGNVGTFTWDAARETSTFTNARGKIFTDAYRKNVLIRTRDSLGNTTSYDYSDGLDRLKITDPMGRVTSRSFDGAGNLTRQVDPAPLSYSQTFTYDTKNNLRTALDGRGKTTTYDYDPAGNLITQTQPGGVITRFGRDPAGTGLLVSRTDPRGKVTAFAYDPAGNLVRVTTPLKEVTTYGYDSAGRRTSVVEARGNQTGANPTDYTTTYTYDAADNVSNTADPLGNATATAYDKVNNPASVTDALGRITSYGYDDADRLETVTAPDATTTTYLYDAVGNLSTRRDAKNRATVYAYDDADRLDTVTSPIGQIWNYDYDANGNRERLTDPAGAVTSFTYDVVNRLSTINYPPGTPDVSFGYDANANRTSMTDGTGTTTYAYDDLNRRTGLTKGADAFAYSYDPGSNLTGRTYPGGAATAYTYDDDSRLATVAQGPVALTYGYDPAGHLVSALTGPPAASLETRTWDRAGRLQALSTVNLLSSASRSYVLDPVGNVTSATEPSGVTNFTYDNRDRLTRACYGAPCASATDFIGYDYDEVGNRKSETRPAGATTYAYNDADQLTSTTGPGGAVAYGYDAKSNQTSAGLSTFAFDAANRLASTSTLGVTTDYAYDGDGLRTRAATGPAAGQITNFAWDTNGALPEIALERDGVGASQRRYTYGLERVAMNSAGADHFYRHDRLGSVTDLTSNVTASEATYTYEPYGAPKTTTGTVGSPMGFAGQYQDPTGLQYLRARYYDPTTGRFLSTDPVAPAIDDPYVAAYVYANNRPTVATDPSGEFCIFSNSKGCIGFRQILNNARAPLTALSVGASQLAAISAVLAAACVASVIAAPCGIPFAGIAFVAGAISTASTLITTGIVCSEDLRSSACRSGIVATTVSALTFGFGAAVKAPALSAFFAQIDAANTTASLREGVKGRSRECQLCPPR